MQERTRGGVDVDFPTPLGFDLFDIQQIERFHRIGGLAMDRAKGGEVMPTHKRLRGAVHRVCIKRLGHVPRLVPHQGQRRAAVGDAINIAPPGAGKARVPVIRHHLAMGHSDGIGTKLGIERRCEPEGIKRLGDVHMAAHRQRVDARIGASCRVHDNRLPRDPPKRVLHRLLHARPMGLALQPEKGGAVEFEGEGEAGQASTVTSGSSPPAPAARAGIRRAPWLACLRAGAARGGSRLPRRQW